MVNLYFPISFMIRKTFIFLTELLSVLLATTSQFARGVLELAPAMKFYPEIKASFTICNIIIDLNLESMLA